MDRIQRILVPIQIFLQFLGKPAYRAMMSILDFSLWVAGAAGAMKAETASLQKRTKKLLKKCSRLSQKNAHKIYEQYRKYIPPARIRLKKIKFPAFHWPKFPTVPSPNLPKINFPRFSRRVLFTVVALSVFFLLPSCFFLLFLRDLPSPSDLRNHQPKLTTHIFDRSGAELYKIYKDENRSLITLDELPEHVIDSTVAIEDKDFWNHPGFSFAGIIRAFRHNIGDKTTLQGGSTITQQLVKNTLLSSEKTITRKIREVVLAAWIERTFTKKEILEMYLNDVSYGGTAYGIQEASKQYFGKDASQLTLAEASLLAGLPAAPTSYSPLGAHPERAYERQAEVLRRMIEDKYISKEAANTAQSEKFEFSSGTDIQAPHFVMYIRDLLVQQYGEAVVNHGGLKVTTTLDLPTQEFVQKIVSKETTKLARLHVSNGAALVTNPKNGDILAMVGSRDYFDFKHDGQVNVTDRPRQPGSAIKPVNYAAALQHGFTPASMILDAPISFQIPGSKPYAPVNYDGKFHGPVPLRTALASSYNIPAVKVLSTIGVDVMIDQGEKMGITTWGDRKRFGLSLTLGGGEITMLDMAEVYGTLANYGIHVPLDPILKIEDSQGKVIYQKTQVVDNRAIRPSDSPTDVKLPDPSSRALPADIAYQLTSILSDPAARAPAFGTHSVLNIPIHQVAVKTGTTNSLRDNWTFGYTTDLVVATWVGNNDNTPMSYIASGITGASPIWANITKGLLAHRNSPHVFPKPDDLVTVNICTFTGQLPCNGCPTREEVFLPGTEPREACRPETIQHIMNQQDEQKSRDQILQGAATQR